MTEQLAHKAKLSVLWNTGFNLIRDALQFCVMLVLVRLLDPEAYGQFGMANSVIGFMSVFAFQGFIAHTIQVRNDNDVHYQDHFTAGAFIQIGMFLVANVVAVIMRYVGSYSEIAPLIHLLSITFLLEWPCELRRKMLERLLDWKHLRILHGIGLITSSVLAIVMALMGAGVYALVAPGLLVTIPFIYELFVTRGWRPTWEWDKARFKPALRFGLTRLGSGLAIQTRTLLESGVIVQILGYGSLGLLGRAVGLSTMFCQRLSLQLMYAIYPVLTKVEPGTDRYRKMSGLVLRLVAWVALPTAVVFAVLAKPVVTTVYGSKWVEVIPLIPWAMFVAALAAMVHTVYMLLLAHHGQGICFRIDLVILCGYGLALWAGLPFGLTTYLQCLILVQTIAFVGLFWALHRVGGIDLAGFTQAFLPPLLGIILAYLFSEAIFKMSNADVASIWFAVFYGFEFVLLYSFVLRVFFMKPLRELVTYLPGKKTISSILFLRGVV